MDGAEVGVLEETNEVGFRGFLESHDSGGLESEVVVETTSNLSDESLEWELPEEEVSGLLVSSDFSEGNGTGSESVGFLDTTSGGGGLAGGFSGKSFLGSLGGGGFSSSLFGTGHSFVGLGY